MFNNVENERNYFYLINQTNAFGYPKSVPKYLTGKIFG